MNDNNYQALLNRIRTKEHPDHGCIKWDGVSRTFEISVLFDQGHADAETVRARALRFLGQLTQDEQRAANIDVMLRDGVPVRAVLRGNTGDLDPARLREYERRAFESQSE